VALYNGYVSGNIVAEVRISRNRNMLSATPSTVNLIKMHN